MILNKNLFIITICFGLLQLFSACDTGEVYPPGKKIAPYCSQETIIANSKQDCSCDITFRNYIREYSFTGIKSTYVSIGPPCNQNVFKIKYINAVHDHNEPDIEFGFYLPPYSNEDFFKADTFQIDTVSIGEWKRTGGFGGPKFDVDVTFIWESVELSEGIYSGKGKFLINEEIPTSFPNYFYPVQEIPFEFCELRER
ncbi:MAG: hypothetical protein ACQETJ_14585 [Bacteroidota bacterium]